MYLFNEFTNLMKSENEKKSRATRIAESSVLHNGGDSIHGLHLCVVGLQWGDEAKGKVVDLLTEEHDVVVRYNGDANDGHTVVVGSEVYKLSLIPSGITWPGLQCVIGNGTVIHPPNSFRRSTSSFLAAWGSKDASSSAIWRTRILPYHMEEERVVEAAAGTKKIGTTGRGIGPCYADKANRLHSIRMHDLLDDKRLRERLAVIVPRKNQLLAALSSTAKTFDPNEIADEYGVYADRLRPYVGDTFGSFRKPSNQGSASSSREPRGRCWTWIMAAIRS